MLLKWNRSSQCIEWNEQNKSIVNATGDSFLQCRTHSPCDPAHICTCCADTARSRSQKRNNCKNKRILQSALQPVWPMHESAHSLIQQGHHSEVAADMLSCVLQTNVSRQQTSKSSKYYITIRMIIASL